jgi:SAM-dependent methyltransferase
MNETHDEIRTKVRDRFCRIAMSPSEERKFPVGQASAKRLGYDAREIDGLPASVTESFSGVGNPLALGELRAGETVVDLGSGAGLDCILAARRVGPSGRVIGVDMTPEMIEKARRNVSLLGMTNVTNVRRLERHFAVHSDLGYWWQATSARRGLTSRALAPISSISISSGTQPEWSSERVASTGSGEG